MTQGIGLNSSANRSPQKRQRTEETSQKCLILSQGCKNILECIFSFLHRGSDRKAAEASCKQFHHVIHHRLDFREDKLVKAWYKELHSFVATLDRQEGGISVNRQLISGLRDLAYLTKTCHRQHSLVQQPVTEYHYSFSLEYDEGLNSNLLVVFGEPSVRKKFEVRLAYAMRPNANWLAENLLNTKTPEGQSFDGCGLIYMTTLELQEVKSLFPVLQKTDAAISLIKTDVYVFPMVYKTTLTENSTGYEVQIYTGNTKPLTRCEFSKPWHFVRSSATLIYAVSELHSSKIAVNDAIDLSEIRLDDGYQAFLGRLVSLVLMDENHEQAKKAFAKDVESLGRNLRTILETYSEGELEESIDSESFSFMDTFLQQMLVVDEERPDIFTIQSRFITMVNTKFKLNGAEPKFPTLYSVIRFAPSLTLAQ